MVFSYQSYEDFLNYIGNKISVEADPKKKQEFLDIYDRMDINLKEIKKAIDVYDFNKEKFVGGKLDNNKDKIDALANYGTAKAISDYFYKLKSQGSYRYLVELCSELIHTINSSVEMSNDSMENAAENVQKYVRESYKPTREELEVFEGLDFPTELFKSGIKNKKGEEIIVLGRDLYLKKQHRGYRQLENFNANINKHKSIFDDPNFKSRSLLTIVETYSHYISNNGFFEHDKTFIEQIDLLGKGA